MAIEKLKEDLCHCLINFDRRIHVTELLQEYELSYEEVNEILEEYIQQQERKGKKFDKRFLLHGTEKKDAMEIYTVVDGEAKLKEWLPKLINAESSLYSLEIHGGAKTPAQIFKPIRRCALELKNVTRSPIKAKFESPELKVIKNDTLKTAAADKNVKILPKASPFAFAASKIEKAATSKESNPASNEKKPMGEEKTPSLDKKSSKEDKNPSPQEKKSSPQEKKPSPKEKKSSPGEKNPALAGKTPAPKVANKKSISSFFAPVVAKKETGKPAKKMDEFFKKQPETPAIQNNSSSKAETNSSVQMLAKTSSSDNKVTNKENANCSVQLFSEEDINDVSSSSDENEKLEAIHRDIISSDHKEDEEEEMIAPSRFKRRRIVDSDDEDPPEKRQEQEQEQEKENEPEKEQENETAQSETFLDEDGFVITVKNKKSKITPKKAKKISSPSKTAKTTGNAGKPVAPPTKSKQVNIMSFFAKK